MDDQLLKILLGAGGGSTPVLIYLVWRMSNKIDQLTDTVTHMVPLTEFMRVEINDLKERLKFIEKVVYTLDKD